MTFHRIAPEPPRLERLPHSIPYVAARYALQDAKPADAEIDALAAEAVRFWRWDEARYWHSVKYHARRLRDAKGTADGAGACSG